MVTNVKFSLQSIGCFQFKEPNYKLPLQNKGNKSIFMNMVIVFLCNSLHQHYHYDSPLNRCGILLQYAMSDDTVNELKPRVENYNNTWFGPIHPRPQSGSRSRMDAFAVDQKSHEDSLFPTQLSSKNI